MMGEGEGVMKPFFLFFHRLVEDGDVMLCEVLALNSPGAPLLASLSSGEIACR
jgi:hypothetical protein